MLRKKEKGCIIKHTYRGAKPSIERAKDESVIFN